MHHGYEFVKLDEFWWLIIIFLAGSAIGIQVAPIFRHIHVMDILRCVSQAIYINHLHSIYLYDYMCGLLNPLRKWMYPQVQHFLSSCVKTWLWTASIVHHVMLWKRKKSQGVYIWICLMGYCMPPKCLLLYWMRMWNSWKLMFSSIKIKVALCCPMFRKSKLMVSHGAQLVVGTVLRTMRKCCFTSAKRTFSMNSSWLLVTACVD